MVEPPAPFDEPNTDTPDTFELFETFDASIDVDAPAELFVDETSNTLADVS